MAAIRRDAHFFRRLHADDQLRYGQPDLSTDYLPPDSGTDC